MRITGKKIKADGGGRKPDPKSMIQGVVRARRSRHCGYHQIGIITGSEAAERQG
jgi:hypothetical protein